MQNPRTLILAGLAALVAVVAVWKWVAGWGLVSLNAKATPLSKVIKTIERQGGVKIATNADPNTPVTLKVERAQPFDVIETLGVRIDGDVRLAYIGAPNKAEITQVLQTFTSGGKSEDWAIFTSGFGGGGGGGGGFGGGGFGGGVSNNDTVIDPRSIEWKVSEGADKNLQTLLDQGAQKTGALFAVPKSWNPILGRLPSDGKTSKVATAAIKNAKGNVQEVVLLTVRPPRPEGERNAQGEGGRNWEMNRTVFSPSRGGGGGQNRGRGGNPEWMAERAQAQIAKLPPEERADAQKQFDEMRAFWQSIRDLPEDQRRIKMEEAMNNPEVQDRMQQRQESRDNRSTPKQREQRMKRYIDRKEQIKGQPAQS